MLTDDDYRELEENRQSAKAQKWAQEKKRDKEAFDFENTQESDENEAENEDLDDDMEADYEPVEVPSAEVELDGSSADATGNQIDRYGPEDDEASAEDTAERASSWMDVFGADPEFARETAEEDEVKSSYMKSMLPAEDYTNERTVDLLDSEDMSDEGKVSDVEPADYDNKRRRKKRSYKYYDDDYASAQLVSTNAVELRYVVVNQARRKYRPVSTTEKRRLLWFAESWKLLSYTVNWQLLCALL